MKLLKLFRFSQIYGLKRALIKALGRLRVGSLNLYVISPTLLLFGKNRKDVAVIGCGQFSYSTISYFLVKNRGACIKACFDVDLDNMNSFSKAYNAEAVMTIDEILSDPEVEYIYITSNHFSHTSYAVKALKSNKIVYIEKPISVNWEQFKELISLIPNYQHMISVGYNRPHSPAIRKYIAETEALSYSPLTFSAFVIGHVIPSEHWYRNSKEGTRICGNVGHWLDLFIHILAPKLDKVDWFNFQITYSNQESYDDDISISITTACGDLGIITITSRAEPFEGINEVINIQCKDNFLKIDDFREMTFYKSHQKIKKKFWHKNVGHEDAIMQPFDLVRKRNPLEWLISTYIMLTITDAVKEQRSSGKITMKEMERIFK